MQGKTKTKKKGNTIGYLSCANLVVTLRKSKAKQMNKRENKCKIKEQQNVNRSEILNKSN